MYCDVCGKQLKDNSKFCTGCGRKIEIGYYEDIYSRHCQRCGEKLNSGEQFCTACGEKCDEPVFYPDQFRTDSAAYVCYCEQCGEKLNGDELFCIACGVKCNGTVAEQSRNHSYTDVEYCEQCGEKLNSGELFCTACGTKRNNTDYYEDNNESYHIKGQNDLSNDLRSIRNIKIVIVALAFVLVAVTAVYFVFDFKNEGCETFGEYVSEKLNFGNDDEIEQEEDIDEEKEAEDEVTENADSGEVENTTNTDVTTAPDSAESETTEPVISNGIPRSKMYSDDWIFPSDQIILTEQYLDKFTREELLFLTNEMYARHGYIFSKEKYLNYFSTKYWYNPTIEDINEVVNYFNDTEKQNIDIIVAYEKAKGYRE